MRDIVEPSPDQSGGDHGAGGFLRVPLNTFTDFCSYFHIVLVQEYLILTAL